MLDGSYLDLLTVSELESLADEVGLRQAMGGAYAKARAGKRADFIKALLAVPAFAYAGAVPKSMRPGLSEADLFVVFRPDGGLQPAVSSSMK